MIDSVPEFNLFSYKENVMKKCVLLLTSLFIWTAYSKAPNSTDSWKKQYGIKQLSSSDKNGLASGLYYLMKEKGNEKTTRFSVSQFYEITNGTCGYQCRNAFQKVFDKTVVASHNHEKKAEVWVNNIYPYYQDVVSGLSHDEKTICFGRDKGKKLPETAFELDRALNPRQKVTTVFQIHTPGFTAYFQI